MAFEELKENTENIQEQAKALESTAAYYKLWFFKSNNHDHKIFIDFIVFQYGFIVLFGSWGFSYWYSFR
jgi:uncharacterized Rmd1/YagE family protein